MFKSTLLFAIVAAQDEVDPTCACLETPENGLPEGTWFTDNGFDAGYGSFCSTWDAELEYCLEGGEYFGEDWCTAPWCYVGADCITALDTVVFDETEYAGTLKWSLSTCAATEEKSAMLYASVAMIFAAVAASI